jgi:hypothetical protein
MYEIIDTDETLKEQFNLITSIKGVGRQESFRFAIKFQQLFCVNIASLYKAANLLFE